MTSSTSGASASKMLRGLPNRIVNTFINIIILDISFIETSALKAHNVDPAFRQIINEIYNLTLEGKFDSGIGGIRAGNMNESTDQ